MYLDENRFYYRMTYPDGSWALHETKVSGSTPVLLPTYLFEEYRDAVEKMNRVRDRVMK